MTASQDKISFSRPIDKTKDVDNCRDTEIIPGIFWMSEDNGANMLIDSRDDDDRVIVHLKPEFEIEKVEEIQSGKSYRITGTLNGKSSGFSMVYGKNRRLYAVGNGVETDAKGHPRSPFRANSGNYFLKMQNVR